MDEEYVTELKCRNGELAEKLEKVFADAVAYQTFGSDTTVHLGDPGKPLPVSSVKDRLDLAERSGDISPLERQGITAVCLRVRELNL